MPRLPVKIFLTILLLWSGCCSSARGQNDTVAYIQEFPDSLNLRLLVAQKGLRLTVQNRRENQRYSLSPWYRNYVGFGGFLWNIGFNVLIPVSPPVRSQGLRRFDFQGSLYGKKWLVDGIYQRYRGFLETTQQRGAESDTDLNLRDTNLKKIQATVTYLPSGEKFSLSFPFNQGYRQRKSGGSLMLSGDFSYKKIENRGGILPPEAVLESDTYNQLFEVTSYSFTSMMGYGATLVYQKFYLYAFGLTGLGFQRTSYATDRNNRFFAIEPVYDLRGAIGYDEGRWYAGIYVSSDYTATSVEDWQFVTRSSQIRCSVGIRIGEPLFLRKIKPRLLDDLKNSPNIPLPFFN